MFVVILSHLILHQHYISRLFLYNISWYFYQGSLNLQVQCWIIVWRIYFFIFKILHFFIVQVKNGRWYEFCLGNKRECPWSFPMRQRRDSRTILCRFGSVYWQDNFIPKVLTSKYSTPKSLPFVRVETMSFQYYRNLINLLFSFLLFLR